MQIGSKKTGELQTDGGRGADPQTAWEREMTMKALRDGADRNPGAVVEVGSDRILDLSGEPGHVQKVITDTVKTRNGGYQKRVRVMYIKYGAASDISVEIDGERIPAGEMTPEDIHPSAISGHAEFIPKKRRERHHEYVERVERYIRERWVPDWEQRERVTCEMGDGDE